MSAMAGFASRANSTQRPNSRVANVFVALSKLVKGPTAIFAPGPMPPS